MLSNDLEYNHHHHHANVWSQIVLGRKNYPESQYHHKFSSNPNFFPTQYCNPPEKIISCLAMQWRVPHQMLQNVSHQLFMAWHFLRRYDSLLGLILSLLNPMRCFSPIPFLKYFVSPLPVYVDQCFLLSALTNPRSEQHSFRPFSDSPSFSFKFPAGTPSRAL